jgi:hypothetical protein
LRGPAGGHLQLAFGLQGHPYLHVQLLRLEYDAAQGKPAAQAKVPAARQAAAAAANATGRERVEGTDYSVLALGHMLDGTVHYALLAALGGLFHNQSIEGGSLPTAHLLLGDVLPLLNPSSAAVASLAAAAGEVHDDLAGLQLALAVCSAVDAFGAPLLLVCRRAAAHNPGG